MATAAVPKASSSSSTASESDHAAAGIKVIGSNKNTGAQEEDNAPGAILSVIDSLKKKVTADRLICIKNKIDENKLKLSSFTEHTRNLSTIRHSNVSPCTDSDLNWLTRRQDDAVGTVQNLDASATKKDGTTCQEESSYASSTVLFGGSLGGKISIRPIKLPEVPKLPAYTTWFFLDRNQRMTENQSVVGRRRIYYDPSGGEALICSDSEDDAIDDEEEKKEFKATEDYLIRMTIQETGLSAAVMDLLARSLEKTPDVIKARYETLSGEKSEDCVRKDVESEVQLDNAFFEKDLDAALDSFDNLFCRRCLVFDCRLHGCSQDLVFPAEKPQPWSSRDNDVPCGIHCHQLPSKEVVGADDLEEPAQSSDNMRSKQVSKKKKSSSVGRKTKSQESESSSNARVGSESSESEVHPSHNKSPQLKKENTKRAAERVLSSIKKKHKEMMASDSNSIVSGCLWPRDMKLRSDTRNDNKDAVQSLPYKAPSTRSSRKKGVLPMESNNSACDEAHADSVDEISKEPSAVDGNEGSRKEEYFDENICKQEGSGSKSWKPLEQGLFAKGLEIFGRNSCLIARNLLSGMKTCRDVFQYMNFVENNGECGVIGANFLTHIKGNELRTRSRFVRRRGRVRRLKYSWKSAGYHFIKRISERKDEPCRQYNPCGCQSACGKQCPCLVNGTCCEKYCGCSKICKNRFRGCHCAKSQCRSRQCPCFAAGRECDPDVCRNCWVGCGDGALGGPNQRGDNYECRNMKLLLKQQQRILLGRSDVSGWGAFLKNSVGKHEYLGEYTGELISHREADKRGKIYDRENSSFLFNLNDQSVLDAYRMGDKLKFANHSPDPNCYAKVIMVAGDHRVGIFAKERISAGEELFYDYRYEPERAPAWARKPDSYGLKDDTQPSSGRAKKLA